MASSDHAEKTVIKFGVLTKKSVVKAKKSNTQNYKNRCFVLTNESLNYYKGDQKKQDKLKGSVPLYSMKIVREVEDRRLDDKCNVFQIGFEEDKGFCILYVVAKNDGERNSWLTAIADEASRCGAEFLPKYHPGVWTKKLCSYNCCDQRDRNAIGCKGNPVNDPEPNDGLEYIALFDFKPQEDNDLELVQGEKYIILNKHAESWWMAEDKMGRKGYVPAPYLKINFGLEQYEWYYKDCSRERSILILQKGEKEGCFLVRDSISNNRGYALSINTTETTEHDGNVRHYRIRRNEQEKYYLSSHHTFDSIPELISFHKRETGGICCRLREPPTRNYMPSTAGFSHGKWQLDENYLTAGRELGRGNFGVVYEATYHRGPNKMQVAVKEMHTTSESDEFIKEVQPMTQLNHPNIVQLYGIILSDTNSRIVIELLINGALSTYLRDNRDKLETNQGKLLDFALQICSGMEYLNCRQIIHRDLAARNCLVGKDEVVKVGDFGLARIVEDDSVYEMSDRSKFPFKWSPPEVLHYRKYTNKSDVWSYGVLMWEIYTLGGMPYSGMKNHDVTEFVAVQQRRLMQPTAAPRRIYGVMKWCWAQDHVDRPTFTEIKTKLEELSGKEDYILTEPGAF